MPHRVRTPDDPTAKLRLAARLGKPKKEVHKRREGMTLNTNTVAALERPSQFFADDGSTNDVAE